MQFQNKLEQSSESVFRQEVKRGLNGRFNPQGWENKPKRNLRQNGTRQITRYFSCCCDPFLTKRDLRRKGFILLHHLSLVCRGGEHMWPLLTLRSQSGSRERCKAGAQLVPPCYSVLDPSLWKGAIHLWGTSSHLSHPA